MSIMFNEICINEEMLPKYTYLYIYIYAPRWGLNTLVKEFSAAVRIMQSSSNKLSCLVSDKV